MRPLRLFVAVDPSDDVRARVREAIATVRPLAPRGRWVDPDLYHLTLAFLGDRPSEDVEPLSLAIAAVAARTAPLDLRFRGAGAFGGRRPRVLWVGVEGAALALTSVQREIAAALAPFGYRPDHPAGNHHLTLARAAGQGGDGALVACANALADADFGETRVTSLVLYKSDLSPRGPTYTALSTLPFQGGGAPA